jgi:hypothetical protein
MYNAEQQRYRLDAIAEFERVRYWASLRRLWAKITRQKTYLLPFAALKPYLPQQRIYTGIKDISVGQIVGSVNRPHDFNHRFQPLRDSSKERWIAIWTLHKTTGWPPIEVSQVGNLYFVEDGHHRVSVARQLELTLIEAEIWEYPAAVQATGNISIAEMLSQLWQVLAESPHGCLPSTL